MWESSDRQLKVYGLVNGWLACINTLKEFSKFYAFYTVVMKYLSLGFARMTIKLLLRQPTYLDMVGYYTPCFLFVILHSFFHHAVVLGLSKF